jgi:cytochrome c
MRRLFAGLSGYAVALMLWGCSSGTPVMPKEEDPSKPGFYTTQVKPIFQSNCYRCHGGMNHKGGLNIATRAGMIKGGHAGAVLVPGDPAKSLLVTLIRHEGPKNDPKPMPPKTKLSDADIALVEQWIKAGAIMPADAPKP